MGEFRVLICGNNPGWCKSLAAAFAENIAFDVGGSVKSEDMIATSARIYPDVVLWKLEYDDAVPVLKELRLKCPLVVPVVLVKDLKKVNPLALIRAGACGCLPIRLLPRQVVQAVEFIVKTGILCLPRPGPDFFEHQQNGKRPAALDSLTGREQEVLSLLGKNFSNQEIARALFISESTVKTHLRSIFRKLGVRNRSEASVQAFRLGTNQGRFGEEGNNLLV